MHAGGGTNDRGEKRNVLMSSGFCSHSSDCQHIVADRQQKVCVFLLLQDGGGEWRTRAMIDDEPRPVWMSPLTGITH